MAGGMETHLRTLAQTQCELGADVTVLCIQHALGVNGQAESVSEEFDGPVRVMRASRRATLARWDFCPGLRRAIYKNAVQGADVIHLHVPNPTMMIPLASLPARTPVVITYHSDIVRQRLLAYALRPVERRVFRRASRVLATSPAYIGGSRTLQQYAHKVDVLPFGVQLEPFLEPKPASLAFADRLKAKYGQPLWLSVGRLVYYKGLQIALAALRHVPGKLLMVGDGPLESPLRAQAEELGVADRVIWLGRLTDEQVAGAYLAATALWFPSVARSEAFGLVQIEAMASGCPVINTDIPHSGVPWVSRHEETGITIPMHNPEALAAASRRLLEEPGLRERLAAKARQRAIDEFGHRLMAQRTLDVYREVCGGLMSGAPALSERSVVTG